MLAANDVSRDYRFSLSLSLSLCSGLWDKYTLTSESTPITSPRYVAAVFKDSESV